MSYSPKENEAQLYKNWEENGFFEVDSNKEIQQKDKTFSIMMPPPNVTGSLHIGHALTFTLQDIITRYKRMDGYKVLWQPGVDHAGIATQNVVIKQLLAQGKSIEDLSREEFLELAWKQKEDSTNSIMTQLRTLGVTPAWSRERFTMDDGLARSVKVAFKKMYEDGYIIKGDYMVNWCTNDGALSDIEVEHKDHKGAMYHIKYPLADGSGDVIVATTRPETYFGDTAVMVNAKDSRYTHLIGKSIKLPIINKEVKIIADEHVDMDFGTGVVKVTPAHDQNDYEVGLRHDLEFIKIFDEKGVLNELCGEFEGLERLEAREVIVAKLKELGFIDKIEEHNHQVGSCYRCGNVVEPYISKQWFVKKEIASNAIKKVNNGEANFFPAHWVNSYNAWMNELRPWCISRQLWWGHRIPVFTCDDCGHEFASTEDNPNCEKCSSSNVVQDPDVLDTWFSSGLWPFSTLGWENNENSKHLFNESDLKDFFPNSLLITGFDILFFWVARMIMMGEYFTGKIPFDDIYLHALVKDDNGEKMSKSKGNVVNPLESIEEYSADILRFTLAILAVQGRDIRFSKEKMDQIKNFTNKLYNASNYLLMKEPSFKNLDEIEIKTDLGKYMYSRLSKCIQETRTNIDEYRFNDSATTLYRFFWGEFCDWGIELSKADEESIPELGAIFKEALKLLNPFMPFLSEYLYTKLSNEKQANLIIQKYPVNIDTYEPQEKSFELVMESIVSIRRAKANIDLGNKKIEKAYIRSKQDLSEYCKYIAKLAKVETLEFVNEKPENSIVDISSNVESFIPLDGVDLSSILNRLKSQKAKLGIEISKLNGMLSNKRFVANAPKEVVEKNTEQLNDAKINLEKVKAQIESFE
ncbi:MAG: Valyl-tRNA synthetase (EC [uncultured Campylobacterales bacterium]|uniref:Valine--tRNA ligase n=1 Tax=uncultured Campylobacterales bacterium TaxID=352960 RepID=A0A6S6SQ92_9BACT|nr:MAG: Valyl-tRNA synthetase (EC [uncultured Campylobacterales bacterium]